MKYKAVARNHEGVIYVFVTRGKSREFTEQEIADYLELDSPDDIHAMPEPPKKVRKLIPEHLVNVFLKDITEMGAEFCTTKYGMTAEEVRDESGRLFPHLTIRSKK